MKKGFKRKQKKIADKKHMENVLAMMVRLTPDLNWYWTKINGNDVLTFDEEIEKVS